MTNAEEWLEVRAALNTSRFRLTRSAARLYPDAHRVAGTPLLCRPEWIPDRPLPLSSVSLRLDPDPAPYEIPYETGVTGREPASQAVRPIRPAGGGRFPSYSAAMAELAAPAVFEDRVCYRLLDADLRGGTARLRFGTADYFAGLDIKEALAHELAAATRYGADGTDPSLADLPLRSLVGDPCDLAGHTTTAAITTLAIRHDRRRGTAGFLLHWRDPAKVAHGGGLRQVTPVGVFQPVTDDPADLRRDLDLWRCIARELSEELLGTDEDYGPGFDHESWPFFRALERARRAGDLTAHCLGLGVDPLSLAVDVLTVVVVEATAFDDLFRGLVTANAEGIVERVPLTEATRFIDGTRPIQAAGAAVLALTLRHREQFSPLQPGLI